MTGKMQTVYLGLGSNLGNREENLARACSIIGGNCGRVLAVSAVYETDPVGFSSDSRFLNAALALETKISPSDLMEKLLEIEASLGRVRSGRGYSSRTIDIDILLYGNKIIDSNTLKVPHPFMHERLFVLEPLNEIAPDAVHPVTGKRIAEMLNSLKSKV
jgi:2-amino-4-hydroxy-6-hydroxymethyldihydropteridine diphosphokinase